MAKKTMASEMVAVLRAQNTQLEREIRGLQEHLREKENGQMRLETRAVKAEHTQEVLFDAVRVLATQITAKASSDRKARESARKMIEGLGITPPTALGSSRVRKKKRTRKT